MIPVNANGVPIGEIPFVRSGLLGFVGPVSEIVSLWRVFFFSYALHLGCNDLLLLPASAVGQLDLCGGED